MMRKTAIVTGGSRGIGFGIALELAKHGYNIAILDVNDLEDPSRPDYKENMAKLEAAGAEYLYQKGDTRTAADRESFVKAVVERFGEIDVLVNNAGVAPKIRLDMLETTEESFDFVVGTVLKGTMFMTQLVANQMLKQPWDPEKEPKRGTIINIGSASATVSSTNRVEYCVAKSGLMMLTTCYADRLAAEGIMVHELRPGVIDTDMTKVVHEKYTRLIAEGQFPIARWGTPEDLGKVARLVCDDDFVYTTGNYIDVDCNRRCGRRCTVPGRWEQCLARR